jgi:hypothetical protein
MAEGARYHFSTLWTDADDTRETTAVEPLPRPDSGEWASGTSSFRVSAPAIFYDGAKPIEIANEPTKLTARMPLLPARVEHVFVPQPVAIVAPIRMSQRLGVPMWLVAFATALALAPIVVLVVLHLL